jgi:AraC family transcriptional regulator, alkane utilization regulator
MLESPRVLTETPAGRGPLPSLDVLSDVLRVVRLSGAVLFRCEFSVPWAVITPDPAELARLLLPGAKQLMLFHLVAQGRCSIGLERHEPLQLESGDIVVFPYGDAHAMASDLSMKPTPIAGLLGASTQRGAMRVCVAGGGGEQTQLVCGFLHCDELLFNPLCKALPPVIHVKCEGEPGISFLAATVRHTISEAGAAQPGNTCLLSRLSELLFIEVLRRHIAGLPPGTVGWLAALNDPVVGRALQLMHAQPAHPWTVDSLARQCGTSRSLLAAQFKALLGQPPMHYLACWRLQLAAEMLRDGTHGIAAIAARTGYDSEPAFNRAFKRYAGEPPATWRAKTLALTTGVPPRG